MQLTPYLAGKHAQLDCQSLDSNPYKSPGQQDSFRQWSNGWFDCRDAINGSIFNPTGLLKRLVVAACTDMDL